MSSSPENNFVTSCPSCDKKYRLAKEYLGRHVKCKFCQQIWRATPIGDQVSSSSAEMSELGSTDAAVSPSQLSGTATGIGNQTSSGTLNGSSIDDDQSWLGKKLGRFQIVEVLGKGAMGVVFRAHDPDLRRDVALKILARQFIRTQKKTYRLEQFIREARSAGRLSHPNTVTVFEIGQDQGWYFIAMELIEGKTLFDLVRKRKKQVPYEMVGELIAQAADALSAAHKLGIIHRDIKPSNLMLTADGRIKVADFGLAQMANDEGEFDLPTKAVGTPYWMSPEQCRGQTAIPQSDIYALGALLFFALTGEVPFRGKTKREILNQHLSTPVPDPRKYRKDIPETFVKIIQRAMAKNPAERYQDAAEMAIGLRQIANHLAQSKIAERWWGQLASTGSITRQDEQKRSSSVAVRNTVIILAVLILIFGGGYWFFRPSRLAPNQPQTMTGAPTPSVVSTVSQVPVKVIKGSPIYHAEGCPRLKEKDVTPDKVITYSSEEEAKALGFVGHSLCEDMLKKQKETLNTPQIQSIESTKK